MARGLELDLHLRPGLPNDGFIAEAIGNLAGYTLAARRGERLGWQVLRVETATGHFYRLIVRHPERALDLGIGHELRAILDGLSRETPEGLRARFDSAQREGLKPIRLRHIKQTVDVWRDDFWNWLG